MSPPIASLMQKKNLDIEFFLILPKLFESITAYRWIEVDGHSWP